MSILPDVVSFNLFSSEDDEIFCSSHHESHKFVAQQLLDLVGLLDGDRHADRVYARLDLKRRF
jgi:hypothetical protein